MTCTEGQKALGRHTKSKCPRSYAPEQGPEMFKIHNLLWKSLQEAELIRC